MRDQNSSFNFWVARKSYKRELEVVFLPFCIKITQADLVQVWYAYRTPNSRCFQAQELGEHVAEKTLIGETIWHIRFHSRTHYE